MLKENEHFVHKIAVLIDCVVTACAFLLAYTLRDHLQNLEIPTLSGLLHTVAPFRDYSWMLVVVIPLWIASLSYFGIYNSMREKKFSDIFWSVFDACLLAVLIFFAIAFLFKWDIVSRTFAVIFFICVFLMLTIEKWTVLAFLRSVRQSGYNYRVLLIVGSGERARSFADTVRENPHWGIRIFGFVDEKEMVGTEIGKHKVIGSFDDIARILDENVIDEVIFILPRKWLDSLEDYVMICEKVGVKATIAVDFFNTAIAKPLIKELHGWPLLTFDATPLDSWHLAVKRLIDISVSVSGLVLLSPFLAVMAVLIKITSSGPVFFTQRRCSMNGREFTMYKFRTMVADAEERLKDLMKFNEREGPIFKMKNDPRVTSIGCFLRRTSLDELPQLINVLKGDMSLIGPRPPLPSEVDKYERWQRRRLSLRPGMACIHEVMARDDRDFERWMRLDLEYIDNWSLSLDARILLKAIVVVFKKTGC